MGIKFGFTATSDREAAASTAAHPDTWQMGPVTFPKVLCPRQRHYHRTLSSFPLIGISFTILLAVATAECPTRWTRLPIPLFAGRSPTMAPDFHSLSVSMTGWLL